MNRRTRHPQQQQANMFSETHADLPLFSGTPMRAQFVPFQPRPVEKQYSMFQPMTTQPTNQNQQKEG